MIEVGPGFVDGVLGIDAGEVEVFERATYVHFLSQSRSRCEGGGFGADVSDAIDRALGAAAADGEDHSAGFRVDDNVSEREGFAEDELLFFSAVRGSFGCKVDGPKGAVGPVGDVNGILVFGGEFGTGASDDAGG